MPLVIYYSNGKIEAKNAHIKTLKQLFYGFKSFDNMRSSENYGFILSCKGTSHSQRGLGEKIETLLETPTKRRSKVKR